MTLSLFSMDGLLFITRWLHFFFGIVWIGHLYYFNFTQGPFFNETDASTKSGAIQKLVPRALWWFRYGALWTVVTGLANLGLRGHYGAGIFATSWGVWILTGTFLGCIMAANVWFVIWPKQKIVIQNAIDTAAGKPANPAAAAAGAAAGLASRHNVLFSIPMLFCMGAASHLPLTLNGSPNGLALILVVGLIVGVLELNALRGKMGPLAKVSGVIHMGFLLTLVLYFAIETVCQKFS
jgi:uncharacterized membrane protein